MQLLCTRGFLKKQHLAPVDDKRCNAAIQQFSENPGHPSLNFERLGKSGKQNHCSIRASQELRVILAVEPDITNPQYVVLVWKDHHDDAYAWSDRHGNTTDLTEVNTESWDESSGETWPENIRPVPSDGKISVAEQIARLERLEEWALFLHPEQKSLVYCRYPGAARIRGGAGTGKTVIALHRAATLGNRYPRDRILYTTFSRSLCASLSELYQQIPDAPGNVDFRSIDSLAARFAPGNFNHDNDVIDGTFKQAYDKTIRRTSLASCDEDYLKDEILRVIKGRAATRDEYLNTDRFQRLGRKRPFKKTDREICWNLLEAWDAIMKNKGCSHFVDRMKGARDAARRSDSPMYRAAIVDEAQDMTAVGLQFVRALVAGDPDNKVPGDGMLILDDSAQRIYKGNTLLQWAGINVSRFTENLTINYRNTEQVILAARAVKGGLVPVRNDMDDGTVWTDRFELTEGPKPVLKRVGREKEIRVIADEIRRLMREENVPPEGIAVLTSRNIEGEEIAKWLRSKFDIETMMLKQLTESKSSKGVRVGTLDRSKGMEFEAVIIPRLGKSRFPRLPDHAVEQTLLRIVSEPTPPSEEEIEARQFQLGKLYVGMSRARKWLMLVANEDPCEEIERACDSEYIVTCR